MPAQLVDFLLLLGDLVGVEPLGAVHAAQLELLGAHLAHRCRASPAPGPVPGPMPIPTPLSLVQPLLAERESLTGVNFAAFV